MPTPAGKPKVGEKLYTRDNILLGTITKRSNGDLYSVWLRLPDGTERIITEFEWHMRQRGWQVIP